MEERKKKDKSNEKDWDRFVTIIKDIKNTYYSEGSEILDLFKTVIDDSEKDYKDIANLLFDIVNNERLSDASRGDIEKVRYASEFIAVVVKKDPTWNNKIRSESIKKKLLPNEDIDKYAEYVGLLALEKDC